jgi:2-dehydro-3-deoxygluconokinase
MSQVLGNRGRCGFVTRIGTDRFSERFAREMAADGLEGIGVMRDQERQMGLYLIELDGVERSFHYWRKDSAARRLADDKAELKAALEGAGLIHLSGITLAILAPDARVNLHSALKEAREAGSIISFDPNIRPRLWASSEECRDAINAMLGISDIVLPSFDDEASLWGDRSPAETVARLAGHGIGEVIVKNGASPVHVRIDGQEAIIPTPEVKDIRDTTGAGDAFNAGYLAARLTGKTMSAAIASAQNLSAEVIRTLGARASREKLRQLDP